MIEATLQNNKLENRVYLPYWHTTYDESSLEPNKPNINLALTRF